jgi:hypothetical protein
MEKEKEEEKVIEAAETIEKEEINKDSDKDIKILDELELLEKVTGDKFKIIVIYKHDVYYFDLNEIPTQKEIPHDILEIAFSNKLYTYEKVKKGEA